MRIKQNRVKTKIDDFLAKISPEGRQEWFEFVSTKRSGPEMKAWWNERLPDEPLTTKACRTWIQRHEREGEYTAAVNKLIEKFRGSSSPLAALDTGVKVLTLAVCEKLAQAEALRFDDQSNSALVNTTKELVKAAALMHNVSTKRDRTEDMLSGAYELARKVQTAVKNHSNSQWVEEVLNGELKQIEDETKAEFLGDE